MSEPAGQEKHHGHHELFADLKHPKLKQIQEVLLILKEVEEIEISQAEVNEISAIFDMYV